jgi:hypothetical protein
MAGFEAAWAAVDHAKDGEPVSPELRPLLRQVYSDVLVEPTDLPALKESLARFFQYLSAAGRTNANCWAVDLFFCSSEGWERDWTDQNLPDDFHDVLCCPIMISRPPTMRIQQSMGECFLLTCFC